MKHQNTKARGQVVKCCEVQAVFGGDSFLDHSIDCKKQIKEYRQYLRSLPRFLIAKNNKV